MSDSKFVELLKQFVAIPSVTGDKESLKQAVDFVADLIESTPNVTIERFESNGIHSFIAYKGKNRPAKFDILLNAHVDVVPAAHPGAFDAYEKDGKVYGRGTLDMKGTALALTQVFIEAVNEVPYALGLQIVSDEEVGGQDGANYHLAQGVKADFVLIGEYSNTDNTIYNAARGICWIEVGFKGKSAHGGHLWNGDNAVVKAGHFITNLLKIYPTPQKETWITTANVASIATTNQTYNKVPDEATAKIDFRFTQEDPNFKDKASLTNFVKKLHNEAEILSIVTFEPSVHVEDLNPYVVGLKNAAKNITGKESALGSRPAASDGRHFAGHNIDVVEFGLLGQHSHSEGEYVEIESFKRYTETMYEFLLNPKPRKVTNEVNQNERSTITT